MKRPTAKQRAQQFAKILKKDAPAADYNYLREIFRHLRKALNVEVGAAPKKLPFVPTDEEIKKYYQAVWQTRNMQHMVIIKTLLYTGVRISELVRIKLEDVDFDRCQIRVTWFNKSTHPVKIQILDWERNCEKRVFEGI